MFARLDGRLLVRVIREIDADATVIGWMVDGRERTAVVDAARVK